MIKRTVLGITLAAVVGATLPRSAAADYDCAVGRITAVTGNSITVFDREARTFTVDRHTRYTNWPTQGAWQAIGRLDPREILCTTLCRSSWRLC